MFENQTTKFESFNSIQPQCRRDLKQKNLHAWWHLVISKAHFQSLSSPPWSDFKQQSLQWTGISASLKTILTAAYGSSKTVGPQRRQEYTPHCCQGPLIDEWKDERTTGMERAGGTDGEKAPRRRGGAQTTKTNTDINSHGGSVSEPRKAAKKTAAGVFVTALQGLRPHNYGEAREGEWSEWVTEEVLRG